jgi:hypothetical protein
VTHCTLIVLLLCLLIHPGHTAPQFLTISDIHYASDNTSQDGHDTGPELFQITLNKFKELSQNMDFILFLGDLPTHGLFNEQKSEQEKIVFHNLYHYNTAKKPLFYIPGNNDSLQGNYQAFEFKGVSPLTYATDWSGACAYCAGLMLDDSQMAHYGYYSSYLIPNNKDIILIALNATQWTQIPWLKQIFFPKYEHQEEHALAQFAWLEHQLKKHHAKQLLIAVHEPPGNSFLGEPIWYKQYKEQFIKLLSQYAHRYGQISILTGHTHMQELRKIKIKGTNIYAYSTPSISRNQHNYPGMNVFILDNQYRIKDFITYYTTSAHKWSNQHYSALSPPDPMFPNCQDKTVAQCLDKLSVSQFCEALERGHFYGVKNPKVKPTSCKIGYPIN